ncbi:hypothetical protein D1B17_11025 [Companilactobacillus zhachilii]|uniref:Surface layer protein A domain-containing protein n=1 Tax=Companilactobacillus zhachilii TaxID=2304606 RepID=A0A386PSU7_9LACO|nr:hypothetical protein [Companilactobacillus zhachilii]AYE39131.1 hypothetical protein D1B17_11025 [Companilactobacillus zhachilii]
MKKFVRWVLVSALALISFGSFSQMVHARYIDGFPYVRTFKTTHLYKAKRVSGYDWDPKYEFSEITDRALSANTNWYADQTGDTVNTKDEYVRVATNEWAKTKDIIIVSKAYTSFGLKTNKDYPIFSFDSKNYKMTKTDKKLAQGMWLFGDYVQIPNEDVYTRVGGNEWVQLNP